MSSSNTREGSLKLLSPNNRQHPDEVEPSAISDSQRQPFEYIDSSDPLDFGWYRNETDGTNRRIGTFDIQIHSKIIRYNPETLKWDSTLYECQVSWLTPETRKLTQSELFVLEPEDLFAPETLEEFLI